MNTLKTIGTAVFCAMMAACGGDDNASVDDNPANERPAVVEESEGSLALLRVHDDMTASDHIAQINADTQNQPTRIDLIDLVGVEPVLESGPTLISADGDAGVVSETNLIAAGVDEADVMKSDGEHIYSLISQTMYTNSGADRQINLSKYAIESGETASISVFTSEATRNITYSAPTLFVDDEQLIVSVNEESLLVFSYDDVNLQQVISYEEYPASTKFKRMGKSDLSVNATLNIEGSLKHSRKIDNLLYLITDNYLSTQTVATYEHNGGDALPLTEEDCLFHPSIGYGYTQQVATYLTVVNADDLSVQSSECVVGLSANDIYFDENGLYVASRQYELETATTTITRVQSTSSVSLLLDGDSDTHTIELPLTESWTVIDDSDTHTTESLQIEPVFTADGEITWPADLPSGPFIELSDSLSTAMSEQANETVQVVPLETYLSEREAVVGEVAMEVTASFTASVVVNDLSDVTDEYCVDANARVSAIVPNSLVCGEDGCVTSAGSYTAICVVDNVVEYSYPRIVQSLRIDKFNLDNEAFAYEATGLVEGILPVAGTAGFYMNAHDDVLRVFTNTIDRSALFDGGNVQYENRLTLLESNPESQTLTIVSQLPNDNQPETLGKEGEWMFGARFVDDTAYLVTGFVARDEFSDPVYKIDLSDAQNPRILGALDELAFSRYLHPINENLLLGIGGSTWRETEIALFDVSGDTPKQIDTLTVSQQADVTTNHHSIATLRIDDSMRLSIPVGLGRTPAYNFTINDIDDVSVASFGEDFESDFAENVCTYAMCSSYKSRWRRTLITEESVVNVNEQGVVKTRWQSEPILNVLSSGEHPFQPERYVELAIPGEGRVINNQDDYEKEYLDFTGDNSPEAIDFATNRVLLFAMGAKLSGGYYVEWGEPYTVDGVIHVPVESHTPGASCAVTEAITSPWSIVQISTTKEIIFDVAEVVDECDSDLT